jgi:hypothetical protein
VVADEEPVDRHEIALVDHRLPAHLGVRAEDREQLRRQRLEDRTSRGVGRRRPGGGECAGADPERQAGGEASQVTAGETSVRCRAGTPLQQPETVVVVFTERILINHGRLPLPTLPNLQVS